MNFGALMILYSEIGGHVLTPFLDTYLLTRTWGLVKYGSADDATVTSLQGSCRWRWLPMKGQLNVTKSRGGNMFVPMISISVWRWPQQEVCRLLWRKAWRLPIDLWQCPGRLRGGSFLFSLVIRIRFMYGFHLVWNSSPSRVWLWLFRQGINMSPRAM